MPPEPDSERDVGRLLDGGRPSILGPRTTEVSSRAARRLVARVVGLLFALGLAVAVALHTRVGELFEELAAIEWRWLPAVALAFAASLLVKAERLRILHRAPGPRVPMVTTVSRMSLANVVLPFGLAEGYLALRLHRVHHFGAGIALSAVVLIRIVDIVVLAVAGALAMLSMGSPAFPSSLFRERVSLAALVLVGALVAWWLLRAARGTRRLGPFVERLAGSLQHLSSPRVAGYLVGLTLVAWGAAFLQLAALAESLALDLEWRQSFLLFVALSVARSSLARAPANLGTYEGAWFLTLQLLGVGSNVAATSAFTSHLVNLAIVVVVAGPLALASRERRVLTPSPGPSPE